MTISGVQASIASSGMPLTNAIAVQSMGMAAVETGVEIKAEVFDQKLETVEKVGDQMTQMMNEKQTPSKSPTSESMNFYA